jgi:hypothetical protein
MIILIVLLISLKLIITTLSANNPLVNKGYGNDDDCISTLLERIKWANNYKGRLNLVPRYMFFAICITFGSSAVLLNDLPDTITFMSNVMITWLFLMSFDGFFSHHADKFSSYAIENNVERIKDKLTLGSVNELSIRKDKFPNDHPCGNFVYSKEL